MDQSRNVPGTSGAAEVDKSSDGKSPEARRNLNAGPARSILDTLIAAGNFTSYVTAIKTAGLTDRLSANNSSTVFAPTDEAFRKLAPGALDALLKDTNKLKSVVNFHIVTGHLEAKHVKAGDMTTMQGSKLNVVTSQQEMRVNGALVTQPDMIAANGVIHAIDTVILPANWQLVANAA